MDEIFKKSTSKIGLQGNKSHPQKRFRIGKKLVGHGPHSEVPRHLLLTNLAKSHTLLARHLGENLAVTELMDECSGTNVQWNRGMKSNLDAMPSISIVVEVCGLGDCTGLTPSNEPASIRDSVPTNTERELGSTSDAPVTSNGNVTGSAHELNEVVEGLLGHFEIGSPTGNRTQINRLKADCSTIEL